MATTTTKGKTTGTKKAATTEKGKKAVATATKTETTQATTDNSSEIDALKKELAELKAALIEAQSQKPSVVTIANDTERVMFLWQAEVADDNTVTFGEGGMYGRIVGKSGSFYVPKNDLSRILDAATRHFIDMRWLIVVSGLTEEEREALGVNYNDGELLDKQAFSKMVELGEELVKIYPELCDSHKEMVAKRYYAEWQSGNIHVDRNIVLALNKIHPIEGFKKIIEEMNERDLA